MKWIIKTHEDVEGTYEVEAETAEDAQRKFEENPRKTGEQLDYSAFDIKVWDVKPAE